VDKLVDWNGLQQRNYIQW